MKGRAAQPAPDAVALEIEAMTAAWNKRFAMACLTMAVILAVFVVDMRERPDVAAQIMAIAPWFLALVVACFAAVRWAIAHQTREILARAEKRGAGS